MAVYAAGGQIRRVRGAGLTLDVVESTAASAASATSNPGMETAKWLIDDDMLISAALGLI
jgi:hypothetical protein